MKQVTASPRRGRTAPSRCSISSRSECSAPAPRFSGGRAQLMAISDAASVALVATVPIGEGVDACRFEPGTQLACASTGDGTLTVIHEDTPGSFTVVANVATKRGARTMELDPKTHRVFTATADFGPPPAATAQQPRPRPTVVPGTFTLLVLDP